MTILMLIIDALLAFREEENLLQISLSMLCMESCTRFQKRVQVLVSKCKCNYSSVSSYCFDLILPFYLLSCPDKYCECTLALGLV